MNIFDFCENLADHNFYDEMIDEAFWLQEYRSWDFMQVTLNEAIKLQIKLEGVEEFDYDTYFSDLYNNTEKGLS